MGVPSYPLVHPDRYALQLLATVLGGGMSYACSPRYASGAGSPTTSSVINDSYTDAGSLFSQAGVDINRIDEAVETIVQGAAPDRRRARAGG